MKLKGLIRVMGSGLLLIPFVSFITVTHGATNNTKNGVGLTQAHSVGDSQAVSEFYAVKGMTLQQTIKRWGQSQNTPIDVANLPDITLKSDKLYIGSLLSEKPDDNVIYQLLADNFGWQEANAPKVVVNNQNLPTDHYQIRFSSPLQKYLAKADDGNHSNIHVIADDKAQADKNNKGSEGSKESKESKKSSENVSAVHDENKQGSDDLQAPNQSKDAPQAVQQVKRTDKTHLSNSSSSSNSSNPNNLGVYPSLYVNKESKVIAFSLGKNDQSAQALSIKEPELYHLYQGQTVRQTIDRWAKRNGFTVVYQTKMDFNITQSTTLYGAFLSKGGPLQTLLNSLTQTSTPLKAEVTANKVLLIKPDRYSSNFLMPGQDQMKRGDMTDSHMNEQKS
ncbi:TcpQ domain-containing protein [Cysteiniphilum sp. 6C5]|uniref:TcpQ domain-containing protein n=1 Tax=unclassified Cysteiniphilum TaxID=2610889 RepID=UPI003F8608B6